MKHLALAGVAVLWLAPTSLLADDFDPWSQTARYQIEYDADLSPLAGSQQWRVWLPLPSEGGAQRVLSSHIEAPVAHRITTDALGNRYAYLEGSTAPAAGSRLQARFTVERSPTRSVPAGRGGSPDDPERYLKAQKRIPLDGLIAQISDQESRGIEDDDAKVRAFYDYVLKNMRYSKQGEGWGEGDAIWACTAKYGNCTDFHSLFIGLARHQSIPARFVIGFPIPSDERQGEVPGYHCWAETYEAQIGWMPLDASEAWKSGKRDAYFGALPSDRVQFTVGRDLVLEPPQTGGPRNYIIYPYAEADGRPIDKLPFAFRFERLPETLSLR